MTILPAVSTAQRRARLLERQFIDLTGRSSRSIADVAGRLGLLHSTDPSTTYLSIHARTDASVADIDRALYEEPRSFLRHTTIRRTVFVMPADLVPLAHGAYNPPLVGRLRQHLVAWLAESPDVEGSPEAFLAQAEANVLERLLADGPVTGAQLAKQVPALRVLVDPAPNASNSKPIRITSKVLEVLAAEGRIARGRPTGRDFTSGAWTWAAASAWWPRGVGELDPTEALHGLLDRYLASFGPATVKDMAWWTGLSMTAVKAALVRLDVISVSLDDGGAGWMRRPDIDEARVDRPAAVALLPALDSTTMGWKQRSWFVDDSKQTGIFDRNGNAGPTIWLGGCVVGAWTQRGNGEVVTELLVDVGAEAVANVAAAAARTTNWLGDVRVKWRFPTPITKRLSGGE